MLIGGGLAFIVGRVVDVRGVQGVVGLGAMLGAAGLVGLSMSSEPWQVLTASWLLIGLAGALTFWEPAFVVLDQ